MGDYVLGSDHEVRFMLKSRSLYTLNDCRITTPYFPIHYVQSKFGYIFDIRIGQCFLLVFFDVLLQKLKEKSTNMLEVMNGIWCDNAAANPRNDCKEKSDDN